MSTTKVKEAKIKARKTSLSNKSTEELIEIILRKDATERSNNRVINRLKDEIKDWEVKFNATSSLLEKSEEDLKVINKELEDTLINNLKNKLHDANTHISKLEKNYIPWYKRIFK